MEISVHLYNLSVSSSHWISYCVDFRYNMDAFQKEEFLAFAMNPTTISPSSSPELSKCTCYPIWKVDRHNTVGIATCYGLNGPAIESRWERDFLHPSRPALGPTQPPRNELPRLLPGVQQPRLGVKHPRPSSTEVKERVQDYIYFPCWPSWPVFEWRLSFYLITLFGNLDVNKVIMCPTNWSSTPGSATVVTAEAHRKTVS